MRFIRASLVSLVVFCALCFVVVSGQTSRDPSTDVPVVVSPSKSTDSSKVDFTSLTKCAPAIEKVRAGLGEELKEYTENDVSVVRMAITLNCVGKRIPGGGNTADGSAPQNWNFLLRSQRLSPFLTKQFGTPLIFVADKEGAGVSMEKLQGKKGIIMFDVGSTSDATGHFELWGKKKEPTDLSPEETKKYFVKSREVSLWSFP